MKPSCRATHKGTCQICGSFQMLPSGVLAKHGYTVKWGFFSGVCPGSGRRPFEEATDAIADAIVNVEKNVAETSAEIARYEDLTDAANSGESVWVQVYAGEYVWTKARLHDFSTDSVTYAPSVHSSCNFSTLRPLSTRRGEEKVLTSRVEAYGDAWKMHTLPEWARFLNRKYAAKLEKTNVQRRGWLSWQAERVASWAPAPLTPR